MEVRVIKRVTIKTLIRVGVEVGVGVRPAREEEAVREEEGHEGEAGEGGAGKILLAGLLQRLDQNPLQNLSSRMALVSRSRRVLPSVANVAGLPRNGIKTCQTSFADFTLFED